MYIIICRILRSTTSSGSRLRFRYPTNHEFDILWLNMMNFALEMMNFALQNDEFCIKNDGFCIINGSRTRSSSPSSCWQSCVLYINQDSSMENEDSERWKMMILGRLGNPHEPADCDDGRHILGGQVRLLLNFHRFSTVFRRSFDCFSTTFRRLFDCFGTVVVLG